MFTVADGPVLTALLGYLAFQTVHPGKGGSLHGLQQFQHLPAVGRLGGQSDFGNHHVANFQMVSCQNPGNTRLVSYATVYQGLTQMNGAVSPLLRR